MSLQSRQRTFCVTVAFILWLLPSIGLIHKYLGNGGAFAVLPFFLLLILAIKILHRDLGPCPSIGWFWAISAVAICSFAVLYPIAKSGVLGPGSDRDDALNVALQSLLAGRYPYSANTYLGNPPTPMLGGLVLALPFYLLGNSALQNLVWVPAFVFWCATIFKDRMTAISYLILFLLACPAAMQDFVTGGDYLVNAMYVAIAMHLVITVQTSKPPWLRRGAEIFLAICISSRPIYVMAVPILAGVINNIAGVRRMVEFVLVVLLVCILLNVPLFLYDPSRFPTAHLSAKTSSMPPWLHASVTLPVLAGVVGCMSFLIRTDFLHRAYGLMGITLGLMLCPVLAFEFFAGPTYFIGHVGFALPMTVFAGIWCVEGLRFQSPLEAGFAPAVNLDGGSTTRVAADEKPHRAQAPFA
ncbi:hypothetical protein [Rhodoplanes sp. Z2-YC6860]|uniref:hypothetical protein n=1 Tax=Rhodoplanes sp. Z2-YC6860 TaxID=674703 RepID=UPI00078DF30C|nr:hypothetical protein [Rhodoplanes sp. Z2-YC6860]AMN43732.1 hypothetical protein RHPLAN_53150 [Rhodoplanes sp. Z2-YC6860]